MSVFSHGLKINRATPSGRPQRYCNNGGKLAAIVCFLANEVAARHSLKQKVSRLAPEESPSFRTHHFHAPSRHNAKAYETLQWNTGQGLETRPVSIQW